MCERECDRDEEGSRGARTELFRQHRVVSAKSAQTASALHSRAPNRDEDGHSRKGQSEALLDEAVLETARLSAAAEEEEPGRGGEGQDARSRPSTKGRSRTHPRLLVGPPHGTTWRTAGAHTAAGQYAGDTPRSCARLAKGAAAHLVVGKEFSHHALSGEGKNLGRGTASASEGSAETRAGLQRTGGDAPSKTISGRRSSAASASPLLSRKDDGRGGGVVGTGESQPRRGSCFARADAAGRSLTSLEGRTLFKDEDLEHGQRRRGTGQHSERSLLAALAAQPAEAGEEGGGAAEQTRGVGGRGERAGEADELSQARAPGQDTRCRPR